MLIPVGYASSAISCIAVTRIVAAEEIMAEVADAAQCHCLVRAATCATESMRVCEVCPCDWCVAELALC